MNEPAPAPLPPAPHRGPRLSAWNVLALVFGSAALAYPLLSVRFLPLLDAPQHIGTVQIIAGGPAAWGFERYYTVELAASPYLLPYLVAAGLTRLIGAVEAVRWLFVLAVAGLPWALTYCLVRFRRSPEVALLAGPLAYGQFLFLGFLNFVLSLPLMLLYLGWFRGALERGDRRPRTLLLGALLACTLFYGHVMTVAFAVGAVGLLALAAPLEGGSLAAHGWRRRAGQLLHLLPVPALFGVWIVGSDVAEKGELGRMVGAKAGASPPRWEAFEVTRDRAIAAVGDVYTGGADTDLLLVTGALLVAASLIRRWSWRHGLTQLRHMLIPAMIAATAGALVFALPASYRGIWPIGTRMVPILLLSLILVPSPRLLGRGVWLGLGVSLCIYAAQVHGAAFARFDAQIGPLDEVIAEVPEGSRVMTLVFDPRTPELRWPALMHIGQYVTAARGGVVEFSFVNFTKSPVKYVEANAPPRLPVRFEWTPQRWDARRQASWYERVLVYDRGRDRSRSIFRGVRPTWQLVHRAGPWALYAPRGAP